MAKPDGGPAYPTEASGDFWTTLDKEEKFGFTLSGGMTLRDHFAGQYAIANGDTADMTVEDLAREAYEFADAMLAEREK